MGIGSPRQPPPLFSPSEPIDSPDGGVFSSASFSQSLPPKQSRPPAQQRHHGPTGKPPLAQPLQAAPTAQEVHSSNQSSVQEQEGDSQSSASLPSFGSVHHPPPRKAVL